MKSGLLCSMLMLVIGAGTAGAQVLVAHDDSYSIPYGEPLIVEFYGVLDNDLLDGPWCVATGNILPEHQPVGRRVELAVLEPSEENLSNSEGVAFR